MVPTLCEKWQVIAHIIDVHPTTMLCYVHIYTMGISEKCWLTFILVCNMTNVVQCLGRHLITRYVCCYFLVRIFNNLI